MIGLDNATTMLVSLALDVASLRHQAIANNIANIDSHGYQPQRVSFEEQLSSVLMDSTKETDQLLQARLAQIRPTLEPDPAAPAASVADVDQQMVQLTRNVVQYQSLLKGLGKQMALLKYAISEGRR